MDSVQERLASFTITHHHSSPLAHAVFKPRKLSSEGDRLDLIEKIRQQAIARDSAEERHQALLNTVPSIFI